MVCWMHGQCDLCVVVQQKESDGFSAKQRAVNQSLHNTQVSCCHPTRLSLPLFPVTSLLSVVKSGNSNVKILDIQK